MATPRRAISRAVECCARLGSPEAFLKVVLTMPRARALRVILPAKARSVPEIFSPTAVATSFADLVTSAKIAFSTDMLEPGERYNFDGERLAATRLIGKRLVRDRRPASNSSKSIYRVMILVKEAG